MASQKVLIAYHTKDKNWAARHIRDTAGLTGGDVLIWNEDTVDPKKLKVLAATLAEVAVVVPLLSSNFLNSALGDPEILTVLKGQPESTLVLPVVVRRCKDVELKPFEDSFPLLYYPERIPILENAQDDQMTHFNIIAGKIQERLRGLNEIDVFISYAREDLDFAELVQSKIREENLDVWLDLQIAAGEKWQSAIDNAIRRAKVVVAIMSPAAAASQFVTYEWSLARGAGVHVIAVKRHDAELHPVLEQLQFLDFRGDGKRNWDDLVGAVREKVNTVT